MTLHLLLASIGVRCFPPDEAPDLCCRRRAAGRTLLACSSPTQIGWVRTHCCPESPQRKHLSSAPCKSAPNGALDSPIGTLGALIHEPPRVPSGSLVRYATARTHCLLGMLYAPDLTWVSPNRPCIHTADPRVRSILESGSMGSVFRAPVLLAKEPLHEVGKP